MVELHQFQTLVQQIKHLIAIVQNLQQVANDGSNAKRRQISSTSLKWACPSWWIHYSKPRGHQSLSFHCRKSRHEDWLRYSLESSTEDSTPKPVSEVGIILVRSWPRATSPGDQLQTRGSLRGRSSMASTSIPDLPFLAIAWRNQMLVSRLTQWWLYWPAGLF